MPTPREWVRICELENAAVEHQSVEKWIEIDRRLDPNWNEEKSKALYQRKEEWLKGCTERLNEARANLSAAEHHTSHHWCRVDTYRIPAVNESGSLQIFWALDLSVRRTVEK